MEDIKVNHLHTRFLASPCLTADWLKHAQNVFIQNINLLSVQKDLHLPFTGWSMLQKMPCTTYVLAYKAHFGVTVTDRDLVLTAKLLRQGYRYHKIRKAFSKFYRRHFDIVSKYNVGLKTLLLEGLSEPEFYGDLVYKFRKIIGKNDFPYHFKKDNCSL